MRKLMRTICREDAISRLPALFAYIDYSYYGGSVIHQASDSIDGCYGKIVEALEVPCALTVDGETIIRAHSTYTYREMMNAYYVPGYPISPIFTFDYSGLMNGVPSFQDVNGTRYSITDFSVYYMNWQDMLHYQGTTVAPHTAGLNLNVQWKDISVSAYFNGRFGGKMLMPKFGYNYYDVWYGKTSI